MDDEWHKMAVTSGVTMAKAVDDDLNNSELMDSDSFSSIFLYSTVTACNNSGLTERDSQSNFFVQRFGAAQKWLKLSPKR